MPDLQANEQMVGSIDPRRETLRAIQWPARSPRCLELPPRKPSWPAVMCDRTRQAGHMDASEPTQESCSPTRSEEHTSELQSLMRTSYAVFCLKKKKKQTHTK